MAAAGNPAAASVCVGFCVPERLEAFRFPSTVIHSYASGTHPSLLRRASAAQRREGRMKLSIRKALAGVAVAVLAAGVAGFVATQGHADLQNPRQTFLRSSTNGVFLHCGMLTSPGYTSCTAWE